MRRTIFLAIALLTLSLSVHGQAERRPNIIMILADDLGWGDVGFNGRKEWKTPNLDRLAKQGTKFNRWYVGGVVCAPSRAVLMTGKYTIHNGVSGNSSDLPAEETTVAEVLRDNGYRTALFGKWHAGRSRSGGKKEGVHPMDHGFDEFFGFTSAVHAWEHFPKELWFGREKKPLPNTNGYTATLFTDRSVEFLSRMAKKPEQPFFLYLAYTEPHLWVEAPAEDVAKQKGRFVEKNPAKPVNANYAAVISRLDQEVGRVIKQVEKLGLEKETLIVFSSDHGATFEVRADGAAAFHDSNHPFRGQKRTLWEGGTRVPALVYWPGKVSAGKVSQETVHMMDVMPTFLAAAGLPSKSEWKLDGTSLLPVWCGKAKSPERTLFWEWRAEGNEQIAAMRGDLKMVITGGNEPEMFDVVKDPAERINLITDYPELAKSMRKDLLAWLETETEASKVARK